MQQIRLIGTKKKYLQTQAITLGMYKMALDLKADFDGLEQLTTEGTRNFVNAAAKSVKILAKQKVPVKTGKTKASIRVKPAKYTVAMVEVDTWLDFWVKYMNGGGYHARSVNIKARKGTNRWHRQTFWNENTSHKRIDAKHRLKSHPAYYLKQPAKKFFASIKSKKTLERYLKLAYKHLESDNNGK